MEFDNFYATNTSGKANVYTTDGSDVAQGKYYRVILAYQTGRKIGESGMLWWKEDVYEDKRHIEVYEFYLVVNSGTISVHNLAVDESSLPEIEGFTQETIKSKMDTIKSLVHNHKAMPYNLDGKNFELGLNKLFQIHLEKIV